MSLRLASALCASVVLVAGGGKAADSENHASDEDCPCGAAQYCVMTFGEETTSTCEPIPAVCNGEPSCMDDECASAMLEACGEDDYSSGCSDTFPPTVVSCNP